MRSLLALALLVGFVAAAPVPKSVQKKKDDVDLIVGRWKPSDGTTQWYEFKADGTMKTWHAPNESTAARYKWSVDPTVTPKRMTWYDSNGSRAEWEAVYELDGDELRMTYGSAGKVPAGVGKQHGIFNGQCRETSDK